MTKKPDDNHCPISVTLGFIGGKWKVIILYLLKKKPLRFGEIAVRIPSISRKVLVEQLKELTSDGLVQKKQSNATPSRVEYGITELGISLDSILKQMERWGIDRSYTIE